MAENMTWFDLTHFFIREATRSLIPAQKRLIATKRGVALDDAPHNKPSTIKQKGFDHWLYETGETKKNVFKYKAGRRSLTLYASDDQHSKGPAYSSLIDWHTQNYSGLFQQLPHGSAFPVRLAKEIYKQVKPKIYKEFVRKFNAR